MNLYANKESAYAGDKLADLLPQVETEQRGRWDAIWKIRKALSGMTARNKKREKLVEERDRLVLLYETFYDELEKASDEETVAELRRKIEGESRKQTTTKTEEDTMAGKHQSLPGMERKKIPDVSRLADKYAKVRDERMDLNKEEVKLKGELLAAMRKHKMNVYKDEDLELVVTVIPGEDDVKVKKVKESEEEAD